MAIGIMTRSSKSPNFPKSFNDVVAILADELEIAIKLERPIILLAIHSSKLSQKKAEEYLVNKLHFLGQDIVSIQINENLNIVHTVLATPNLGKVVFFISDIDWGGGDDRRNAYRALNFYRELFIAHRIRSVFWLNKTEATNLPHYAPDFWAFRHRVIEFPAPRGTRRAALPAGTLLWRKTALTDPNSILSNISYHEKLLTSLVPDKVSLPLMSENIYELAHLYWYIGNNTSAKKWLTTGMELVEGSISNSSDIKLQNGMAILSYDTNLPEEAARIWEDAISSHPEDNNLLGSMLTNLAIAFHALGRNSDAIATGNKAIKKEPQTACFWLNFGYLYTAMEEFDRAVFAFEKAIMLAPNVADYYYSLAVSLHKAGRQNQSIDEIKKVGLRFPARSPYQQIIERATSGSYTDALELLEFYLERGDPLSINIRRDPNIYFLFGKLRTEPLHKKRRENIP